MTQSEPNSQDPDHTIQIELTKNQNLEDPHVPVPEQISSPNEDSTSSNQYPRPQERWSKSQDIELVNIIGEPTEGMLTRSMAAKLATASANECLFVDFLCQIEPKV